MEWTSNDVVGVISYLLPGFLAAWVFYGLTTHPRKTPFERVVQALIFTAIIQGAVAGGRLTYTHYYESGVVDWGEWGGEADQVLPPLVAVVTGVIFAAIANNDLLHFVLRKLRITKRTSYSSNWYSAFNKGRRYVTLHLRDGRRVYGWPYEFPDQSTADHFALMCAYWVPSEGDPIPLPLVERLLIPARAVKLVELMKEESVNSNPATENQNGKPSAATPTKQSDPTLRIDGAKGGTGQATGTTTDQAASIPSPAASPKTQVSRKGNRRNHRRR